MAVTAVKSLGLSGVAASLVTLFTSTGNKSADLFMGIAGVVIFAIDHLRTVAAAYRTGASTTTPTLVQRIVDAIENKPASVSREN